MDKKDITRKYILLGIILFVVVGLFTANILAKKQDEKFAVEDLLYTQALQLYEAGDYKQAETMIEDLIKEQADSEVVNHLGGLIAASNGDYKAASVFMQKSLDLNPYKVENAMFMLQFGEILLNAERFKEAKIILQHCQEVGWAPEEYPEYQEQLQNMLKQLENL